MVDEYSDPYGDPETGRFATDTVAETPAQKKKRLAEEARRRRERAGSNGVTDQSFGINADDDFDPDAEISESDLGREDDSGYQEWTDTSGRTPEDRLARQNAERENERLREERENQRIRDDIARQQEDRENAARTGTPYVPQDREGDPPLIEKDEIVERIRAYNQMDQSSREPAGGDAGYTYADYQKDQERLIQLSDDERLTDQQRGDRDAWMHDAMIQGLSEAQARQAYANDQGQYATIKDWTDTREALQETTSTNVSTNPYYYQDLENKIKSGDISGVNPYTIMYDASLNEAQKKTLTDAYNMRLVDDATTNGEGIDLIHSNPEDERELSARELGREDDRPSSDWVDAWEQEQADKLARQNEEERQQRERDKYAEEYDNTVQEGASPLEQESNEAVDRLRLDAGLEVRPDKPTQDSDGVPLYTLISQGKIDGKEPVFWSEATQSWELNYTADPSKDERPGYDREADLEVLRETTEALEIADSTPEELAQRSYTEFDNRFKSSGAWPTREEILADPNLTDEQKQNFIDRYYTDTDEEADESATDLANEYEERQNEIDLFATPRDRYGALLKAARDLLAGGGDPSTVNWNELRSAANEAGVGDLFDQKGIIDRGASTFYESQRPQRQSKAYNDLIGEFMRGGTVDPQTLAMADLNDQQRQDIQGRLNTFNEQRDKREAERKAEEDRKRVAQEQEDRIAEDQRQADERDRIAAEQEANQNPLINTPEEAEASAQYNEFHAMLYDSITSGDRSRAPTMYEIETSNFLSAAEKQQLRSMFPKEPLSVEEQADKERDANADTKSSEDYAAISAGKEVIEVGDLKTLVRDVMDNLVGTASEEQILELVSSRLGSQNLFADSATLLNTIASVNDFYYEQFEGTRSRPLTFIEREEQLIKDREDTVVTVDEVDTTAAKFALFKEYNVDYEIQSSPEEAYRAALDSGASPTEAYKVFKAAGGVGSPPQGKKKSETVITTNEDGSTSEDVQIFELTDESYGHGFSGADIFKLKGRAGETKDEFWERAEGAKWLTEIKDPDSGVSYSALSPTESDAIVDLMISTIGQNLEDSPELANVLEGLERYKNSDDGEKNALQEDFTEALTDALAAFGDSDLDEEKRLLRESAKADYDDQLEEANRYFLVNGLSGSGQEQRGFEDLSSQYLKGLRDIDLAISQKKSAYVVTQIQTLTEALASVANINLSEDKLDLTAEELEEQGRQFDANLKQNKEETDATIEIRNRELGIEQNKFYETIRQFNKSLSNEINEFAAQWGLSEMETVATVRKINADIANQTRSLSNEISQTWASITGVAGDMEGEIALSDLGIPPSELTDELKELPAGYLAQTDIGKTISDSWSAMTGQNITLDQLKSIVDGDTITVAGMPTLQARQIATGITMQNLDRMNKYATIAKENDFEVVKFEAAKDQADRSWYLTIGDVSESFGLSNDAFRDAKYQYDKMFDPLSADPAKNGEEFPDLIYMAEEKAREIYLSSSGVAPGDENYDEVNNAFRDNWNQANEVFDNTHGNQLKDIAQANKFEEEKFLRANKQADLQEEKYETVWGALMGARDKDPTHISIYNTNRTLWDSTLEYVNKYTDTGTGISEEAYASYQTTANEEAAEGMDAFMTDYDPSTASSDEATALVARWKTEFPKKEGETAAQHSDRAYETIGRQVLISDARKMVQQIESGDLRVMGEDNITSAVDELMDNPPPGLFEHINNQYGILNDDAKRDVLTGIINSTVSNREIEQYRNEEGLAIVDYADLELDWVDEDNVWKDDTAWFKSGVHDANILERLLKRSSDGGVLSGVSLSDFLNPDGDYTKYLDQEDDFQLDQHGKAMLNKFNSAFNLKFGRNPTVKEAMVFRNTGELDLESDDPSAGYVTSMNIRLVPENWIDSYNEPGQLEGIFALLNGGNVTPERNVGRTSGWSKFGNIAGGIVGAAAGAFAGGVGAKVGEKLID